MNEFLFKYIPEAELSKIVKEVKRERRKKIEEKQWEEHLELQRSAFLSRNCKQDLIVSGPKNDSIICYCDSDNQFNKFSSKSTQQNGHQSDGITFNSEHSDGNSCIIRNSISEDNYCDVGNKSLQIDLEKINKLDKLRIFDSAWLSGFNCSDSCSRICHRHSSQNDCDVDCHQEINECCRDQGLQNSENVCQQYSVGGINFDRRTLEGRDNNTDLSSPKQHLSSSLSTCISLKNHYVSAKDGIASDIVCTGVTATQVVPSSDGDLKVRIDNLKQKLKVTLDKILKTFTKNKEIEDDNIDFERKMKKTKEFISRFSRNYLYQLRRQFETMKKMNLNAYHPQVFSHKLMLSYLTSLQALQAFQNILPDKSKLSFEKVEEFLKLFLSLLEFSKKLFGDCTDIDAIKSLCFSLIAYFNRDAKQQQLMPNIRCKNLAPHDNEDNKDISNDCNIYNNKKRITKKQKSQKKLSMYCSSACTGLSANWRKSSASLAKKKFGFPCKNIVNGSELKKSGDNKSKLCITGKLAQGAKSEQLNIVRNESDDITFAGDKDIVVADDKESDKRYSNDEDAVYYYKKHNIGNACVKNHLSPVSHKFENSFYLQPPVEITTIIESCPVDADNNDNLELPKDCEARTRMFLLFDRLSEMILQNANENKQCKLKIGQCAEKLENRHKVSESEIKMVLQQIHEMYLHPESLGLTRKSLDEKCPINVSNSNNLFISTQSKSSNEKKYKMNLKNSIYMNVQFDEEEHRLKVNKTATVNSNGSENSCVELKISDELLQSILKYHDGFVNYLQVSSLYEQFDERWSIVKRITDYLLSKLIASVSKELEVNLLLQKMYELEFTNQVLNNGS